MSDNRRLLDAFAELRRTWDDLITLQPDVVSASGPLTAVDLQELQQRVRAHEATLAVFAETVRAQAAPHRGSQ